jgi:DNA-binding NtrC family response regulator
MDMLRKKNMSVVTERPVLILDLGNDFQDVATALIEQNWIATTAPTVCEAVHVVRQMNIKIAIAIISSNKYKQTFDCIDKLQNISPSLLWLAISMEHPVIKSPYAQKLSTYFVDYFHCPIDWRQFAHTLGHLWGRVLLQKDSKQRQCQEIQNHFIVGRSRLMKDLNAQLEKVAPTDGLILISGETGTGKGLCAQRIHYSSARKDGPLVTVNCAALPASLIHSELFGYEKGAYTGAEKQYIGKIERANNGTLFLDEIGDLPLELQVNLLKFIDDYTIERLGGNRAIKVDCRIILATHVDLENAVAEGKFREDLYHRLNILRIHVPSLREHREDIALLAQDYFVRCNQTNRKLCFSNSALELMFTYNWPGNVRELKNRILRAVVMADGEQITAAELGIKVNNNFNAIADFTRQHVDINSEVLLDALNRNNNNISAAARALNISRTTFYRLIKKYNTEL